MLGRSVVTHVAVASLAVVSSSRRGQAEKAQAEEAHWQWLKTRDTSSQKSSAEIKRDLFIFQNPHGLQDYALKGHLGDGSFSSVSLSVHKRTGQPRAIKKIRRLATDVEQFEAELRALISLDHPHIVKILEYFEDQKDFHVVFELCTGKDLLAYITESDSLHKGSKNLEQDAAIILRQSLKAVIGCHAKGFVHRDLKPDNFLFVGKDLTIKLIDFGLVTRCDEGQHVNGIVGTEGYMAPEILHGTQGYDKGVDIWSLGVIFFVLLTLEPLLPDGEERKLLKDERYVKQRIRSCDKLANSSSEAIDLLEKMLEWDPRKRITAYEILQHPFITACGCEQLCELNRSPREESFNWQFDKNLPSKMERYAKAPHLRQIGLRCLVHLASTATLPDALINEVLTARHHFRSLNPTGTGQVLERQLRARLQQEQILIPENFSEICQGCQHGSHGPEAMLDYDVLVACILIDAAWPDSLLREVFNILDRSRDGIIEALLDYDVLVA